MLYCGNHSMRCTVQDDGFEGPVMGSWNLADDTSVARISPAAIREEQGGSI